MEAAMEEITTEVDVEQNQQPEPNKVYQTCLITYLMCAYFHHSKHNDMDSYLYIHIVLLNCNHDHVLVIHLFHGLVLP